MSYRSIVLALSALASTAWAQPRQPAELAPMETPDGVLFQCYAPQATYVFLAADFNQFGGNRHGRIENLDFAMSGPDSNGVFRKTIPLAPGLYRYKFAIEGTPWIWFIPDYEQQHDQDGNAYLIVRGTPDTGSRARSARAPRIEDGRVIFELFAPDAHIVYLAGNFNNWANNKQGKVTDLRFAMRGPDSSGIWRSSLPLGRGRHSYQFVINGREWISDPLAAETTPSRHSIVEVR